MQNQFYYRLKPIAIDFLNETEVERYNSRLTSFRCLEEQFDKMENAFINATKERADIFINVIPEISGVIELSVFHKIKYKLFSRSVKSNGFSLCITQFNGDNQMSLYFYETENFKRVKQIFEDFIVNKKIPDLTEWNKKFIG